MIPFKLHRICAIMEPEKGNEFEVEGVLILLWLEVLMDIFIFSALGCKE